MTAEITNRLASSMRNGPPIIQITTLYEDLEAGLRAKLLLDLVQRHMDASVHFKPEFWRFNWLEERSQWNISLGTAKTSALVIISVSGANTLPAPMERWVKAWNESQGEGTAALVLLSKERSRRFESSPLNTRLQRVANRKQLNYFCEFFDPQIGGITPLAAASGGSRDRGASKLLRV